MNSHLRDSASAEGSQGRSVNALRAYFVAVLVTYATADFLGHFDVGFWSLLTWSTFGVIFVGALLFLLRPRVPPSALRIAATFAVLVTFSGASLVPSSGDPYGIHFTFVISAFVVLFVLASSAAHRSAGVRTLVHAVGGWTVWMSTALAAVLWITSHGELLGPRSMAMFLLVPYSIFLARWRVYGVRAGWPAIVALSVMIVSLSRGALVTGLLVLPFAFARTYRPRDALRAVSMAGVAAAILVLAVTSYGPLRTRFFSGDLSLAVGGVAINSTGRTALWGSVIDSFLEAPVFGQGAGSAMTRATPTAMGSSFHPHNEYLRVAHDFGIVGLLVFIAGLGQLFARLRLQVRRSQRAMLPDDEVIAAAGLNVVLCFFIIMLTDNPLAYAFFMAPLALIAGTAVESPTASNVPDRAALATK